MVNKENLLKKNNFTKKHWLYIAKLVIVKGKHVHCIISG